MGKRPNDESHMEQQLNSLVRQQEHMDKQMTHILRLIQGDTTLNTLRPTGLLNNIKEIDERLQLMQKNTEEIVEWWNDRSKRKYIINVDLVQWGKVIAWVVGIVGGVIGMIAWLRNAK